MSQPPSEIHITLAAPALKEVKIRIRGDQHLRLVGLKACGHGDIADHMQRALDLYFQHLKNEAHKGEDP